MLKYQGMILVAINSIEDKPDMQNKRYIDSFQTLSSFNAQIMLNCLFQDNKLRVMIPQAGLTLFLHGILMWRNSLTLEGLAA